MLAYDPLPIFVLAFRRSNFGAVVGEGTALLFNTKDFSLFLCRRSTKELTITGSESGPKTLNENLFPLGKFV